MANKPNNPSLWSKAKSLAKQKFDVYPSAYANGWAAKWYKSKGGTWRKAQYGMEIPMMEDGGKPEWLLKAQLKAQGYSGNALDQKLASMAGGGEPQNAGFQALPEYVQNKIMSNMAYGGGYIPEMAAGGWAQQAAIAIAMKKAGKKPKSMQDGGEPDGAMALGQIDAAVDKLSKLRQFIQPDSNLEPWVSSKLTLMDHYTDAVSDYMMYNPEAQEEMMEFMEEGEDMEEMKMGGIPQRYKNMGFTKVGVKKDSTRPGKKWMVLAKKGDQYKVVHGGYTGMKDYTQHGSEKRRENFWNRMGGKNSAKATDPFSPLYWHKRFGTWQEGGEINMPEMKAGGSTWSGNAWYQDGGEKPTVDQKTYEKAKQNYYRLLDLYGQDKLANIDELNAMTQAHNIMSDNMKFYEKGKYWTTEPFIDAGSQLKNVFRKAFNSMTGNNYDFGGYVPQFGMGGMPCYECGGMYAEGGEKEQEMAPEPGGVRFGRGYGKRGFMGIKPVKHWTGRNDSKLENFFEIVDPTGISSWDDLAGDIRENKGKKRNWLRTASNVLSVIPRFRALYPGITFGADLPKYVQIAAPARIAGDTSKMWRYMEDMSGNAVDIFGGDYKYGGHLPVYQDGDQVEGADFYEGQSSPMADLSYAQNLARQLNTSDPRVTDYYGGYNPFTDQSAAAEQPSVQEQPAETAQEESAIKKSAAKPGYKIGSDKDPSLVNYLIKEGMPYSYSARTELAAAYGIDNYRGTADQNTKLLNMLRQQKATASVEMPCGPDGNCEDPNTVPQDSTFINPFIPGLDSASADSTAVRRQGPVPVPEDENGFLKWAAGLGLTGGAAALAYRAYKNSGKLPQLPASKPQLALPSPAMAKTTAAQGADAAVKNILNKGFYTTKDLAQLKNYGLSREKIFDLMKRIPSEKDFNRAAQGFWSGAGKAVREGYAAMQATPWLKALRRFGRFEDGGYVPMMQDGSETGSVNYAAEIGKFLDPTGISSYGDVYDKWNDPKAPWWDVALTTAGALPVVGKFGKGAKAAGAGIKAMSKLRKATQAAGKAITPVRQMDTYLNPASRFVGAATAGALENAPNYVQKAAQFGSLSNQNRRFWTGMDMMMGQPEQNYKHGGIHINPANKGKFTASAKRAGMGVQEFAAHVLANKEDYSSTQVKRANFARNAAKWKKQDGGPVEGDVLDVTPEELERLRQMGYQFEMI